MRVLAFPKWSLEIHCNQTGSEKKRIHVKSLCENVILISFCTLKCEGEVEPQVAFVLPSTRIASLKGTSAAKVGRRTVPLEVYSPFW